MSFGVFLLIAFILVTIFLIINPQLFKKNLIKSQKLKIPIIQGVKGIV
ncbi:hypothetical protein LMG8526HA_01043 [Lactococcus lactis]|nr:hypothetical protein [Lactococcus lactis]